MNLDSTELKILDQIKQALDKISGKITEKKGIFTSESVIAERKSFLSKKKLMYIVKFMIDNDKKELIFSEMLKESGFGLSSGTDDDIETGAGFKSYSYKTGSSGKREETIEEQSDLFGKKYNYIFDYGKVRQAIEKIAIESGYKFIYKIHF